MQALHRAPMGGYSLQAPGPSAIERPKKQSTRLRVSSTCNRPTRGCARSRRYREHARILEGVDRLRLEAMDEHSRSVVWLQDKYGRLTAAVLKPGAVEQQEKRRLPARLAQQWNEHVKTGTEHRRVRRRLRRKICKQRSRTSCSIRSRAR